MRQIFTTSNYLLLLRTIILDNSDSCFAFYDYWTNNSLTTIIPKLERLIIKKAQYYQCGFIDRSLIPLSTGCYYGENKWSSLYELKNLQWSHTVQLTLTVQFPFEIIFVLQNNAIPCLEYLYITIEHEKCTREPYMNGPQPQIEFCENHILQMADATRLRTLVLRHLSLHNITILIRSLNMPLLKKLIVVEIFDETLVHYEELRQIINHKRIPCLKEFYFLICFPEHVYEEFQKTIVNTFDSTWPFNNLAYHIEEQLLRFYNIDKKTKRVILFYTSPLHMLLQYTRTVFNHSFAQYSRQINRRCMRWKCNEVDNLTQLTTTFNKLAAGYVDTLILEFYEMKVIKRSERAYIIDQILYMSPRLSQLTVEWEDLSLCSRSNTNVKHLRLRLNKNCKDPDVYVNINYLVQLLPSICCLETSHGYLSFNENLVKFIVKIVDTIDRLVQLVINKNGLLRLDPKVEVSIEQAIFNTGNKRLLNSKMCQISFPHFNELRIWLS
ncbi:unnamed protein product [Adineta steineri]|uniref:Uncharacterized protein n=1 Tax=Adineta steineri TaxID=433720 RepID=A0A815YTZ2_9BILA|nr:unnamed protein product [Adineta steineri]CAF1575675.1 unnamed protein product [Adineta steineri]